MFNKSTKTIAIFLLIFFIGDRILSHAAIFVSKFSTLPYAKLYNRKLESNILILGNSRAYRHYYENDWSSILNLNASNLSLPGAPLIHLEAILDDYVNIYGEPKYIFLELDSLTTNLEIIPSFKFLMFFSKNYSELLKKHYRKVYFISNLLNLYKLNSNEYLNIIHKIFKNYEQPKLYNKISFNQLEDFRKSSRIKRFISKDYNLQSLERIIKKYSEKSDIVFLISPFHPEVIKKYEKEINNWKMKIEKKNNYQIRIFDFSNSIKDDKFFNDPYHLNNMGVKKLKKILLSERFFEKIL